MATQYLELSPAAPLLPAAPAVEEIDSMLNRLSRGQQALDRFSLGRKINLIALMQRLTPAAVQRKIADKRAIQTVQYLARNNRACIHFWRENGIRDLAFVSSAEDLRKLPPMREDFFHRYSPQDRLSIGSLADAQMITSSGSTGQKKLFFMTPQQVQGALPALKQFLRASWEVDRYEHVAIVVGTARAEAGQPAWGAGYHMAKLLELIAGESEHISYEHVGLSPLRIAEQIKQVAQQHPSGKTLVAVYTYAPSAVPVVNELADIDLGHIDLRFMLTGEAFPPYRIFRVGEQLGLIPAGLAKKPVEEIVRTESDCRYLAALTRTFSFGFGAAELKTGISSSPTTVLWELVMFLLEHNEPQRVRGFLSRYFGGEPFPWTALKSSPNVYTLLGDYEGDVPVLQAPPSGRHYGPAFATSLSGEVVNCSLDVMHLWDMDELAGALREATGINIKAIARHIGLSYEPGDMLLTNGRLDSLGRGGLDAAASWGGLKIYGHHLRLAASTIPELTGAFTAQNVDYPDGRQVLWLHLEAAKGQNLQSIEPMVAAQIVRNLEELNQEFAWNRQVLVQEQGEAGFSGQVQIRVLGYGHERFALGVGQPKYKYIWRPTQAYSPFNPAVDPLVARRQEI